MAVFSVLIVTAAPAGGGSDAAGWSTKIDGREAIVKTVELFLNRDNVKQVQVAFLPQDVEEAKRKHGGHFGFSGVKVVTGGPKWIDQCAAATEKLSADASHVIVHDAARPAVPYSDIDALMDLAQKKPAVTLAAPMRSPLVETDEGGNPVAVHAASRFMQLLTPQAFSKVKFLEIVASKQEPHASQFSILKGSALNVRIGGGGDASLARAMIGLLPKPKIKPPSSPFEEARW
jgi:2-C-methyl-D-erythritol 4-phosphate cytidylyltransferase